jgi:hypothetical protein
MKAGPQLSSAVSKGGGGTAGGSGVGRLGRNVRWAAAVGLRGLGQSCWLRELGYWARLSSIDKLGNKKCLDISERIQINRIQTFDFEFQQSKTMHQHECHNQFL